MTPFPCLEVESILLPDELEDLGGRVLAAAKSVIRELGPGMRERVYRKALAIVLEENGISVDQEVPISIVFHERGLGIAYAMDLLVANRVIVEDKSVTTIHHAAEDHSLTYMSGERKPLGYAVNLAATVGARWI